MQYNFEAAIQKITDKLNNYRPRKLKVPEASPAAVIILFLNVGGKPHILFTKRSEKVEHHKGQISFPGGMRDEGDENLMVTALRETWEEIGIPAEQVEVLGRADDLFTVTNFLVTPFVGILKPPFEYVLSEDEVAEVLTVPLDIFLKDEFFEVKQWPYKDQVFDVYFYTHTQHIIWGATGFILNRFIDVIFDYNPSPNPVDHDPRREKIIGLHK